MSINLFEPDTAPEATLPPGRSDLDLDRDVLRDFYARVRQTTKVLCEPLETEDYVVQSMPDASPTKWHLAHTSWFFETFVLTPAEANFKPVSSHYSFLFNSYYNAVGERIARDRRGLLSRPTVAEVFRYRAAVDDRIMAFLDKAEEESLNKVRSTIILGLHHEQQHQELIVTDLKHGLSCNPLRPAYREQGTTGNEAGTVAKRWIDHPEGLREIGHGGVGFAFDNETPKHPEFVAAFSLADRLVTNREFLAFMEDGGYARPEFWLSDGWFARNRQGWIAPLYWESANGGWREFTLTGMQEIALDEPVCHVSYYEADAYTRWAGARLATEAEWETAVSLAGCVTEGNFLESGRLHPSPVSSPSAPCPSPLFQMFGDVWEWTQSPYTPYRGFNPAAGALGEYNGKFMCNQFVLRGGSCATPASHIRATYRNFFPPEARWQFSGIRLCRDI